MKMKFCTLVRLMIVLAVMGLAAQVRAAQVYLDVQAPYSDSSPQWKVWTWADGQNGYWVQGNEIVVLSNGLIEATVNEDNFQFVRCSSDGNTEWNRTVNLRTVADATYTITGWGSGSSGMTVDVTNPTYNTVTLDLSKVSETDKVWYAWAFATGGNGSWVAGTQSGDEYTFDVASIKDKIIFVRMNANGAPSWNSGVKLNQTDDVTLQPDGTYVITDLESTNMKGYWKSQGSNGKDLWHQDPNGDPDYYLGNRKALVGRHCMVNKLVNVVGVGSWINDLNNLVDEDLENWATFPKIADVGVGVNPVTSVRDTKNHYAAGTTAGFNVVLAADASLLDVDLANCFAISFFLEGELQQTVAVDGGQAFGGVGLSLITLPGSTDVSLDIAATAPCEFDEIALMPAGVQVSVLSTARLRYAFVGDLIEHTITETSMQNYAADHDRMPFTLDQGDKQHEGGSGIGVETGYWAGSDLINDDLTDGVIWGVIGIGSSMEARVGAAMNRQDPDQSQPFKAGSVVGFCYGNGSILNLPIGDAIRIRLYEGHWVEKTTTILGTTYTHYEYEQTEVQDESVAINVLSVELIKGGNYQVTIKANHDFSHARISFPTGLTLNLGGNKVKYAFICDPVTGYHKCNLGVSADVELCADDTQYQLTAEGGIPVTWSIVEQPSGANASVDQNGLLTDITVEGDYVVRATATDGCYEDIVVTSGLNFDTRCDMPISNDDEPIYALSEELPGADGALINIGGYLLNKQNVLNNNYNDYATLTMDLTLVENLPIVGVKKLNGNFSTGAKRRVGFVVETKSTGLTADALDLFNIRCYKNGVRTYWHVIDETNVVKAKVIGSGKMQKLRYSITVPADVEFDEFALWKSGVLDLELERFRVYYAFDEDAEGLDAPDDCGDPLGCAGRMVSNKYDNATLNSNEIQFAGAVNAANVADNLSFLVDDDINSAVSVTNTVSAGNGIVFAVDLGRVYGPKQQIGIVLDDKTYLAKAKVGNWLTIKTYLNGVATGDEQSDWSVIGVNAIGYGDKSFLFLNPTQPYDEVRITVAALVDALDFDTKYFGIFVRSDYDGDGTPDCQDDYTCPNPLGVDVRYESSFDAANELNLYKNTVKVYNIPEYPVMVEQLAEDSEIRVYRTDNDDLVGTITVTGVTTNQDGTYSIGYTSAPAMATQDHYDSNRYPDQTGTLTADEWGYVDFADLFIVDQFSAGTSTNTHAEDYHYKAILLNNQRNQRTESQVMEVPVLKTDHEVNAATFTQAEVEADTDHHLTTAPVDIYVQMKNDADILKYKALKVAGSPATADTVAWAERVDSLTFTRTMMDNNGNKLNWGSVVFPAVDAVQTVVLRDSTLQQPMGVYVPTIFAYTNSYDKVKKDTVVVSSYGADRLTDEVPSLAMTVIPVMKSYSFSGYMSYTADINLVGQVPSDMQPYLYRIWRVMPDGTEVLLDTLASQSGGSMADNSYWYQDYDQLHGHYPSASISVRDIFFAKKIGEGESLSVNYIARLYAETDLPTFGSKGNRDGEGKGYGIAPASGSGEWNDGTPTGICEIGNEMIPVKTTYYNPLGMSSSKPFDGLNIIVIQYMNGETIVLKHMY